MYFGDHALLRLTFSNKVSVNYRQHLAFRFREHNHSFPYVFSFHFLQGKRHRLSSRCCRHSKPFAFDRADSSWSELTQRVRTNENAVALVDNARFDDTRYYCTSEWDGKGIVDLKFERALRIVPSVVRKDIKEEAHQVEILASDVGHLEDGTYSMADKLRCSIYAVLPIFDKGWDFARAGAFHDFGNLSDAFLKNVGRANVNFGNNHHDRYIQRQGNSKVFFAHGSKAMICGDHKYTVVWAGGEHPKDCSA